MTKNGDNFFWLAVPELIEAAKKYLRSAVSFLYCTDYR